MVVALPLWTEFPVSEPDGTSETLTEPPWPPALIVHRRVDDELITELRAKLERGKD